MLLQTQSGPFFRARSVNQTSNGYVSKIPTATEPAGDAGTATGASVFDLVDAKARGGPAANGLLVCPYAIGSNNNTFSLRVIGWRSAGNETGPGTSTKIWIPVMLCELACTVSSTPVGLASKEVIATELFADTLTITHGNSNVSVEILSNAADLIAHALVDLKGFQKFELSFTTGGSATSCNALLAYL